MAVTVSATSSLGQGKTGTRHSRSASTPSVFVHPPEEEDEDTFCCYDPEVDASMVTDIDMLDQLSIGDVEDEDEDTALPSAGRSRTPVSRPVSRPVSPRMPESPGRVPGHARSVSCPMPSAETDPDIAEVVKVARRKRDVPFDEEEQAQAQAPPKPRTLRSRAATVLKTIVGKTNGAKKDGKVVFADASNAQTSTLAERSRADTPTMRKGLAHLFTLPGATEGSDGTKRGTVRSKHATVGRNAWHEFASYPAAPSTMQAASDAHLPMQQPPSDLPAPSPFIRSKPSRSTSALGVFSTAADAPPTVKRKGTMRKFSIPELNRYFNSSASKPPTEAQSPPTPTSPTLSDAPRISASTSMSSPSTDESSFGPGTPIDLGHGGGSSSIGLSALDDTKPTARLPFRRAVRDEADWERVGEQSGEMRLASLHFDSFHMDSEEFRRQLGGL